MAYVRRSIGVSGLGQGLLFPGEIEQLPSITTDAQLLALSNPNVADLTGYFNTFGLKAPTGQPPTSVTYYPVSSTQGGQSVGAWITANQGLVALGLGIIVIMTISRNGKRR